MRTLRLTAVTTTAVAVALGLTAVSGCGAVEKALDCAHTAVVIAESVDDLQRAVSGGAENPEEAQRALDKIDKNLDTIDDSTGDADVKQAVDDLQKAVTNADSAVKRGENPDVGPVSDAANELTKICTPG